MQRKQSEIDHNYKLEFESYPISDNDRKATYDQFINLRDTLVYTNKYYGSSAGRSLIIGTKLDGTPTNTIEIREPNLMLLNFEPGGTVVATPKGQYVEQGTHSGVACDIIKTGRYVINHKEQFNNISSSVTEINSYVIQHTPNGDIKRAEFDWAWSSGSITKLTAIGYVECDLVKGDWLELVMVDQGGNDITSLIAYDSNRLRVEYIDLAYNIN